MWRVLSQAVTAEQAGALEESLLVPEGERRSRLDSWRRGPKNSTGRGLVKSLELLVRADPDAVLLRLRQQTPVASGNTARASIHPLDAGPCCASSTGQVRQRWHVTVDSATPCRDIDRTPPMVTGASGRRSGGTSEHPGRWRRMPVHVEFWISERHQ
ncbi:hypothetical protein [Micromonospora sp. WMMD710]|uniref:hypothetical protein n=1 Tax=Micromonospora sp. WMMD710 TaxID=3016085 RepID=UPI002416F823|nr:hypothetical protein [Micromonospora sp. WMMD710]MDG4759283.1 hypothetical protein [Micromonospora sp. WMMD710]